MHTSKTHEIISFYEFINLTNLEQLKLKFFSFKKKSFRGTIIISMKVLMELFLVIMENVKKLIIF